MSGKRRFDAVLFDLDGTLVDSLADIADAAHAVRRALALRPLSDDRIRSFVGDGARRLVARTITDDPDAAADAAGAAEAFPHFEAAYGAGLVRRSRPYPGVMETLATLHRQGIALGVVTNKPIGFTERMLTALQMRDWFAVVVGGDSLAFAKPHPLPLQHALQCLDCPPERALMVGDGRNDLLAAAAAGCPAVLVRYGYDHAGALATGVKPLLHTDSLVDLHALLENP